ncbi:hypothetical protein [Sphingopyxis sp. NFH-91]|jgi:hypothetical protein|uniref:hypothetical protein n=1 Tax=Sphingopyxis sp. NFH-91 TaxID=2744457 RepID=UPI001F2E8044|nr:hypothetical protein [Sphingopyxis sp. NFH-91]
MSGLISAVTAVDPEEVIQPVALGSQLQPDAVNQGRQNGQSREELFSVSYLATNRPTREPVETD